MKFEQENELPPDLNELYPEDEEKNSNKNNYEEEDGDDVAFENMDERKED